MSKRECVIKENSYQCRSRSMPVTVEVAQSVIKRWNDNQLQSEYNARIDASSNPFDSQGGLAFEDTDMDAPTSAGYAPPRPLASYIPPDSALSGQTNKKRTLEDCIEEETEGQELAFSSGIERMEVSNGNSPIPIKRCVPAKRRLAKTQSLCVLPRTASACVLISISPSGHLF